MDMIYYNPDYAIRAFGLQNTGVICYFNSMLQSFLSCTSVIEIFSKSEELQNRNPLCRELWRLIKIAKTGDGDSSAMSPVIWRALMLQKGKSFSNFGNGQEDTNEGFLIFLDALDAPEIVRLFEHRYRHTIVCGKCNHSKQISADENVFIEFSLDEFNKNNNNLQHMILHQTPEIDDAYKCEKCGEQGEKSKTSRLSMVPEVLAVMLKKYDGKWNIDAPQYLKMPLNGKQIKYRLVATNEHSGSRSGGHYWANALRADNTYYNLNDAGVQVITELNDTNVQVVTKLKSTANTYMLWYHIVESVDDLDELMANLTISS